MALLVYVLQYIAGSFRFALGGIRGKCHAQSGPHDRRRCRNLCRTEARTQPASPVAILPPLWPDCCHSVSNSSTGRISPSQTACGLEFSPPLVWPIARGTTNKPQTTDLTMTPCGSTQGEQLIKWDNDRTIYKRRKEVERLFRRLKGYRRIFSRFEKLDVMYSAFLNFALIVDMIKC